MRQVIVQITASSEKLAAAIQRTHLAFLDLALEMGQFPDMPRSWEVEREHFMRGLGAT